MRGTPDESGANHYSASNVKRSLAQFLIGKAFNAVLAIGIFVLIAHLLPKEEYGYYVAAFALFELGLILTGFGMEWVTAVYVPQYRIKGASLELTRFALTTGGFQAATHAIAGAVLFAISLPLATALNLEQAAPVIGIYGAILLVEGTGRMVRDQLLTTLLMQGAAQVSQSIRNMAFLCMLLLSMQGDALSAVEVGRMELLSSLLGAVISISALAWQFWRTRGRPRQDHGWEPPGFTQIFHLAKNAYATNLASLAGGPQVMTMLIARTLGVEATALYGFVRNFVDQVNRHLPAMLLLSILRPSLIARYSQSGDFGAFSRHSALLFKLHVLALAPIVVFFGAYGGLGASVLGSAKFADAGLLIAMMLLVLAPSGHRRIADTMAHSVELSHLCRRASLVLLLTPAVVFALLHFQPPLEAVVTTVLAGEIIYSVILIGGLERAGFKYVFPWNGTLRLGLAVMLSIALLRLMPPAGGDLIAAIVSAVASTMVFGVFAVLLAPLSAGERRTLFRFIGLRTAAVQSAASADS